MTDRGLPSVDGPPACPFIAFEDERDERASSPDHRHRCYAEVQPAPRALAHQEAYCLSSAFPVCPTFQDWARREAAQARGSSVRGSSGAAATAASVAAQAATRPPAEVRPEEDDLGLLVDDPDHDDAPGGAPDDDAADVDDRDGADEWSQPRPDAEPLIRRNPPRDWAAPPPWASGSAGAGSYGRPTAEGDPSAPEFLASRPAAAAGAGLAGSAADRLASGQSVDTHPSSPPSDELAGLVAEPAARSAAARPPARSPADGPLSDDGRGGPPPDRQLDAPQDPAGPRRPVVGAGEALRGVPDHQDPGGAARRPEACRVRGGARGRGARSSSCCRASSAWVALDQPAPPGRRPARQRSWPATRRSPTVHRGPDAADLHDQGGRHPHQDRQEVRADGRRAAGRQQADQEPEQDRDRAT